MCQWLHNSKGKTQLPFGLVCLTIETDCRHGRAQGNLMSVKHKADEGTKSNDPTTAGGPARGQQSMHNVNRLLHASSA
jgi:hypothetical protein